MQRNGDGTKIPVELRTRSVPKAQGSQDSIGTTDLDHAKGRRQAFAASVSLAACIARVVTGSSVSSPGAWRILFVGESSGVQVGARLCRQQQQLLRNRAAALPASPAGTAGAIRRYSYCSQSVIVRSIALRNLLSAQEPDVSKRAASESGWGCRGRLGSQTALPLHRYYYGTVVRRRL